MFKARVEKLKEMLHRSGLEAVLIGDPYNKVYLSGFKGTFGWLVVTLDRSFLLTDFRYMAQAEDEVCGFEVIDSSRGNVPELKSVLEKAGIKSLAFESEFFTYKQYKEIQEGIPGVELVPVEGLVEKLRARKDSGEIDNIKKAAAIADEAFARVLEVIKPGIKEKEVAEEIEFFMRKKGSDGLPFGIIVASGFRAALPHGTASEKEIKEGDMVVMDFGAFWNGYCSDITRTVFVGKASDFAREIYNIVFEAQKAALEALAPGRKCSEVDDAARSVIGKYGYRDSFGHATGHGVGLNVHEAPLLKKNSEDVLAEGMVVTVEPGIYIREWGGVRIEDMALILPGGFEILTRSTKEIIEV